MQLEIRPWIMEDAYDLRILNETTKQRFFQYFYPDNFLRIASRIRFYQNADPTRFAFRVIVVDGVACGYLQCEKRTFDQGELSYFLDSKYRHQGIMQQAIKVILQEVYEQLSIMSVYARVREDNIASQNVLKRCGFMFEKIEDILIFTKYR